MFCLKKPTLGLELVLIMNRIMRISINRYLLSIVYNSVSLLIKICLFVGYVINMLHVMVSCDRHVGHVLHMLHVCDYHVACWV